MSSKLFGSATVVINGKTRDTNKGASLMPGGTARTTVKLSKSAGFTEQYETSKWELEFKFGVGDSIKDFDGADIPAQFHCDTGQTYTATVWRTDVPALVDNGLIKVTYEGPACEEIMQ